MSALLYKEPNSTERKTNAANKIAKFYKNKTRRRNTLSKPKSPIRETRRSSPNEKDLTNGLSQKTLLLKNQYMNLLKRIQNLENKQE
jgi:hypothetical protein